MFYFQLKLYPLIGFPALIIAFPPRSHSDLHGCSTVQLGSIKRLQNKDARKSRK